MLRILLISLSIFLFSGNLWAQNDAIAQGRQLIQAYEKMMSTSQTPYYRYLFIHENIGPLKFVELNLANMAEQIGTGRKLQLTQESRDLFARIMNQYRPSNFQGADKKVARRVQNILQSSLTFANSLDARTGMDLVRHYENDGYSIRRSVRDRMKLTHLSGEIARFAAAIVIVRIATCFGSTPNDVFQKVMVWQNPANKGDVVCVDELVEMLKSPIFYIGFSAFIMGSAVGNAATLKALKKIDPMRGPRTQAFERAWVPNIALAIGFMSDFLVKTLLENKHLKQCATVLAPAAVKSTFNYVKNNPTDLLVPGLGMARSFGQSIIATDEVEGEKYEVIDFYGAFKDTACRKAGRSLSSSEFLSEQLGVGLVGLVTTAVAMSKTTQYASRATKWVDTTLRISDTAGDISQNHRLAARARNGRMIISRAARKGTGLAARMAKYVLVVPAMASGVGGLAIGTARMVLFLGLFEVINPFMEKTYWEGKYKSSVDHAVQTFAAAPYQYTPANVPLHGSEKCGTYYTGLQDDGSLEKCSRIPMIAELETFSDHNKTWRKKHILKEFYTSHGRWMKKLSSFINNYFASLHITQSLTRSREMYLKFKEIPEDKEEIDINDYISEYDKNYQAGINEKISNILEESYSTLQGRDRAWSRVKEEYRKSFEEDDYDPPIQNMTNDHPLRKLYEELDRLEYQKFLLELLPLGTPFKGVGGLGNYPDADQLDELATKIMAFIGDKNDPNYERIEIKISGVTDYQLLAQLEKAETEQLVRELGMPLEYSHYPFNAHIIQNYLLTPNPELNAIGILLFQQWAPYMNGRFDKRAEETNIPNGFQYNPRGLHPRQWALYKEIIEEVAFFSPIFPWEMTYINSNYDEIELDYNQKLSLMSERTDNDGQFDERSQGLQTKKLADFVLTQLMCGGNSNYRKLFGDNGGVSLQFNFPHLFNEKLCNHIFIPINMADEDLASPFRSLFASENGLYPGLHMQYIKAPKDIDHPLLFNAESEAYVWWNDNIKKASYDRLGGFQQEYIDLVKEDFTSKISQYEISGSGFGAFVSWAWQLVGGQSQNERDAQRSTTTESLTVNIINEFHHYRSALEHFLTHEEKLEVEPVLIELSGCLFKILDSIPDKKYRETKSECVGSPEDGKLGTLDELKKHLIARNDKYKLRSALNEFEGLPEENLNNEQRRDRVIIAIAQKIIGLFAEINYYNELANESFQFRLDQ